MKKTNHSEDKTLFDVIVNSLSAALIMSAIAICFGIFFIITSTGANKPIAREEAVSYSGTFEKYESRRKYCRIYFEDGSQYSVYPHTQSEEFRKIMMSLEKGTKLYILENPNNGYVAEIKTDTEELLNFVTSQEEIDKYDNGYNVIGCFIIVSGVLLLLYAIKLADNKRKENAHYAKKRAKLEADGGESKVLRYADSSVKSKILAQASAEGYKIIYRRVKSVNELVINGKVYDEKKAVIEFPHKLYATLDGHSIEAGLNEDSYSYIMFDGEIIEFKKRLF